MTSTSNLHSSRLTGLVAMLVAVGATACTVDKNLSTVSDGDTEVSTGTTAGEPTSSTTGDTVTAGDTSSGTTDDGTTDPTTTTANSTTAASTTDGSTTDGGTTDGGTTGEPAAGCPEHPTVDDCCCFEKSDIYVTNVCTTEQEVLCADVTLLCMEGGGMQVDGECAVADDEALVDCALSALAGNKAGSIRVILGSEMSPGMWTREIDYHITGDGGVYRVDDTFLDLSGKYKDTGLYNLWGPDFFTACLAGSISEKADCLRDAVLEPANELCIPGFSYDDF